MHENKCAIIHHTYYINNMCENKLSTLSSCTRQIRALEIIEGQL